MERQPREIRTDSDKEEDNVNAMPRALYRVCRLDENPAQGLTARYPDATDVTVAAHVHGQRVSPYISTCASFDSVRRFRATARRNHHRTGQIVRIDLRRLMQVSGVDIIDLTDMNVVNREFLVTDYRGRNYVSSYEEFLITGHIPANCITILNPDWSSQNNKDSKYVPEEDSEYENDENFILKKRNGRANQGSSTKKTDNDRSKNNDAKRGGCNKTSVSKGNDEYPPDDEGDSDALGIPKEKLSDEEGDSEELGMPKKQLRDEEDDAKELRRLTEELRVPLESHISKRKATIRLLNDLVKTLNQCRTNGNITMIAGAGVSILGAAASIASIPLTGGLSLIGIAAGGVLGLCGGITGIASETYVNSCETNLMQRAGDILKDDQEEAEKLQIWSFALDSEIQHLKLKYAKAVGTYSLVAVGSVGVLKLAQKKGLFGLESKILSKVLDMAGKASKASTIAGIAKGTSAMMSVVFVPLDIWQICTSSGELFQGNSEKAKHVRSIVENLEKDLCEKELQFRKLF